MEKDFDIKNWGGLEHDDYGLTESDEILLHELLSHKLDFLTECIYALAELEGNLHPGKQEAVNKFWQYLGNADARFDKQLAHSIEQFKERKNG